MFKVKNKINFKKIFMLITSMAMVFAMAMPNFTNAMNDPYIDPTQIRFDEYGRIISEVCGEVIDKVNEDSYWYLGTD